MSTFNGGTTDPAWFDAMGTFLTAVGALDPRYIWWSAIVGNRLGAVLVNMENLCQGPVLTYPDMNQTNIDALGLTEMCRLWMFAYFQSLYQDVS
jgi:hypothetical protein